MKRLTVLGSHGTATQNQERCSGYDALVVAVVCVLMTALAIVALPRPSVTEAPIAIFFPPWLESSAAIELSAAAGYRVMRTGRLESILIVAAPAAAGETPMLPTGAWFALSLDGLAGCLDPSREAAGA